MCGRSRDALASLSDFDISLGFSDALETRHQLVFDVDLQLRSVIPRADPAAPHVGVRVVGHTRCVRTCHHGFHNRLITHHRHVGKRAEFCSTAPLMRWLQHVQSVYCFVRTCTTPLGSVYVFTMIPTGETLQARYHDLVLDLPELGIALGGHVLGAVEHRV